jgi:ribA/ribD-fused uncharacterized protein
MALACNDKETAKRMMSTHNCVMQKHLSKEIQNFENSKLKWAKMAENVMEAGLMAKFSQNLALKKELLMTGIKDMAELNPSDARWGCQTGLWSRQSTQPLSWLGSNRLGKLLEKVCETLKQKNRDGPK